LCHSAVLTDFAFKIRPQGAQDVYYVEFYSGCSSGIEQMLVLNCFLVKSVALASVFFGCNQSFSQIRGGLFDDLAARKIVCAMQTFFRQLNARLMYHSNVLLVVQRFGLGR
jgi:hypothetical protein